MERISLTISKGQRLVNILPSIQTNTILEKTICGCGATTLELEAKRNSIIVEPNIPVIVGKMKTHANVCGVYQGVSSDDIAEYIQNQGEFKKIMTTPEGFTKIKSAFRKLKINMYKDYFLLFDECEKLVQDIEYRPRIALPINDFFKFENKAMVSATPIMPSDPRFEEQSFSHIKVSPNYNYSEKLFLHQTNNPILLACYTLNEIKEAGTVCVFFNTIKGIQNIIDKLGIAEFSNIYCGNDSALELKEEGLVNAYSEIETDNQGIAQLNKYNFFTSRFYSAVDIILQEKPIVIIVTESYCYPYTMVDPKTEAIQIYGRFRNGVAKRMHITNYNYALQVKSRSQLDEFLNGQHNVYSQLYEMRFSTVKAGEVHILDQALKSVDYSRFVDDNCNKNFFMYDNAFAEEHTKGMYKNRADIKIKYGEIDAFDIRYKYIPLSISNMDCIKISNSRLGQAEINKVLFKILKKVMKGKNKYDKFLLNGMRKNFPKMCHAYEVLGEKGLVSTNFSTKNIEIAVSKKLARRRELQEGVVNTIHNHFKENQWYSTKEINDFIKEAYSNFNLAISNKGCARKIKLYFNAEEMNLRDKRGWKLGHKIVTHF